MIADLAGYALTARQQEILSFIEAHIAAIGWAPTVREIGTAFGIRSTNGVADHLRRLQRKGRLYIEPEKSRAMRVLPAPEGRP